MSDLTMKLLLVEDNPTDALLLEEALNEVPNLKFQLAHVARLDEGMKALESHKFDAVLLDLGLPDSQGLATLAKMQKRHPNVPILVLTGLEDATLAVNAVRAGAQDYLTKGKTNGTMLAVTIRYAIERKRTDALLHERAQFQRTLLENFPNGSVNVLDRDLRYVVAEGRDLVAPSDSLVGKSLEEIFAPAQAAEARSNYQKVLAGECVDFEMCNDGRWWSVSAAPLPSVHGEIETILSIAQDMTARKEAEDERDRFFTLSLDLLGIATLDGHWIRVNPAFSEHLGFSSEEIMASPIIDLVHPDDVAATIHRIGDLASGKTVIGFENRYRTNLGTWRNLEWKGVSRPDAGLMYCAARDVTDRKLSEEALRKAHTTLETRVRVRTAELAKANVTLKAEIVEREAAEAETRYRARQQEAVAELGRRALLDVDMDTLLSGATSLVTATLGADLSTFLAFAPDRRSLRVRAGSGWKHGLPAPDLPIPMTTQAGYSLLSKMPTIVTDMTTETRFDRSKSLIQEGLVSDRG